MTAFLPPARLLRLQRPVAAACLVTLLTACGTMIPEYQRPAAPVAAAFANDTAPAGAPAAADIAWQDFFQDARLRQLIGMALQNNRDLRVAVLNIDRARAQLQVARADQLPTVAVGAQGQRASETTNVYQAGFTITGYEFDFFGRVRSAGESALAQLLATEEGRKTVQISLVASVANTYLSLLADDALLRVTRDTLASREESLRLTRLTFERGVTSEIDFRQAESQLEAARVALAQQTRQRALDSNALELLVGQPLDAAVSASLPAALPLTGQGLTSNLPAGLPSELLARRPDVRQAEQLLLAANANIGAARAAFFPRISLTAGIGFASSDLDRLFSNGLGWSFAPSITLPIFDAGRNQANLDASNVSRDIAVAQYEKAIQTAFREVADALATRATLTEQLRAQAAQAAAAEATLRLVELRYRNGVASSFELLDAQRTVFTAQQAVVQTQLAQAQNQVNVYQVLGGGWKDVPPPPAPAPTAAATR